MISRKCNGSVIGTLRQVEEGLGDLRRIGHSIFATKLVMEIKKIVLFGRGQAELATFYRRNYDELLHWHEQNKQNLFSILSNAGLLPLAYLHNSITVDTISPDLKISVDEICKKLATSYDPLLEHPDYWKELRRLLGHENFDNLDLDCVHIEKSRLDDGLFVKMLSDRIATLWDERWFVALQKTMDNITKEGGGASLKTLFSETFADRFKAKSVYEKKFTNDFALPIQKVITLLETNRLKEAVVELNTLLSKLSKSFAQPRQLKVSELWPDYREHLGNFHVAGKKLVSIDDRILAMVSKSFPKKITLRFEDGSRRSYLLKTGELIVEQRISEVINVMADLLDEQPMAPSITLLTSDTGLVEWIPEAMSVHQLVRDFLAYQVDYLGGDDSSLEAYRRTKSTQPDCYAEFVSMVPHDLLLSYFNDFKFDEVLQVKMARHLAHHCVIQYCVGLGDRHLDNILISSHGFFVQIDLGLCLEEGRRLPVPEIVPYRLTPLFQGIINVDEFKKTFIQSLQQFRKASHLIRGRLQKWINEPAGKFSRPIKTLIDDVIRRINERSFECASYENDQQLCDALFLSATDPSRLAAMYDGWQPWL